MSETNPIGAPRGAAWTPEVDGNTTIPKTVGDGTLPPAGETLDELLLLFNVPMLPAPKIGGLSLETLVQAVGMEERATATKSGLESIKVKAQERDEVNAQKMEEIQKRLEDMKSKSILDGFLKAFKIIGMILGAVASIASIAIGAATGNPLLIAAGVIMATMVVNSILSEATGGKVSIGAGIGAIAKACGASDEVAHWIGFGFEMAITLVGCALSFGAGFSAAAAPAVQTAAEAGAMAQKVVHIVSTTQQVTAIASGVNSVGQGIAQGVGAYYDFRTTNSLAEQKELAAILERIQEAINMEQDFMQAIMERANKLMGDVGEIVQQNAEAQTAVLSGSAPSMA